MDRISDARVVIIVQARMGSTRLPNKVLKEVMEKPLLGYLLERLEGVETPHTSVVATTNNLLDDEIVEFCNELSTRVERGSEEDVLDRYYQTAKSHDAEVIVRVTADCPLIDPALIDQALSFFFAAKGSLDFVSNTFDRTFPRGMDVEVFSFDALERAWKNGLSQEQREHPTQYFHRHADEFQSHNFTSSKDLSCFRLTVDTPEDFSLIAKILETLYPDNPQFTLRDVVQLLEKHPDWVEWNAHVQQKAL